MTDDLVAQYWGLARQMAGDWALRWPPRERADIESDANLGLLQAARTYDETAGMTFIGWARIKIKSQIIAGLRNRHGRSDKLLHVPTRRTLGPPKAGWSTVPLELTKADQLTDNGFALVDLAASLDKGFTDRDRGVLVELAEGYTCREVGARRGVSESRTSQMRTAIRERALELGLI